MTEAQPGEAEPKQTIPVPELPAAPKPNVVLMTPQKPKPTPKEIVKEVPKPVVKRMHEPPAPRTSAPPRAAATARAASSHALSAAEAAAWRSLGGGPVEQTLSGSGAGAWRTRDGASPS
jgi:protein TonB